MSTALLELQGLAYAFAENGMNVLRALDGVDLRIHEGEFVTVIGSNGAGKTTLFNLIAGVYLPDQGRVLLEGEDITRQPEHVRSRRIGRVFQNPAAGAAAGMSIAQNLTLALLRGRNLSLRRGVTTERRELFREHLATLGLRLEDRLDEPVASLSGGQRQALTLLIATLAQPKLLLLDEHTAALDPAAALKVLDLTGQLVRARRLTTLMITHNMQQALDFGDRLLMMDRGKIALDLNRSLTASMNVQDLVALFKEVKQENIVSDELLLSTE